MMEKEDLNKPEINREERELSLRNFLVRYARYWYVVVLSVVISLILARYYNWYQNPVFAVNAKLHVRDENTGREGLLKALDVDPAVKNIENEIEIIRSYNLLAKTLHELEFDVSYFLVGDVKVSEVYKDAPFQIEPVQLSFEAYSTPFEIYLQDSRQAKVTYNQSGESQEATLPYGDTLHTTIGSFALRKRDNFPEKEIADKDFSKRKYRVRFNTMGYNQNRYLSRLSVGLARPQSTILSVYLEDEVPQKALDFVNKLVEVYLSNDIDQKNKAADATRVFLDDQLTEITEDLERIEINRERYKVSKGIIDLQSEAQMVLESIKELDAQRTRNKARIGMIDQLERYVVDNADLSDLAPAALDINDPLLIKLINKLSELQSERQGILNRATASDPKLVPLNAEIELTRSSLLENIRNIRKGFLRTESELNAEVAQQQSRMMRVPTTERELLEIERRFRIQEGLYTFLLQKRAELSISLAAAQSNTRLVDSARLLPGPIRPVPGKAYSIALVLGILVPVAFIFLLEKLHDKVVDPGLIKRITGLPLIGIVRVGPPNEPLVSVKKPRSPIAEEYRSIRANLRFYNSGEKGDVFMVTSSIGTEGKTFTASNLACVLAASGQRVVLVGLDLRKPRIVEDFGIDNGKGCSNYLSGQASLQEVTRPSGVFENFDVIPSGPVPPNPSELILSPRMAELFSELKETYDAVVIDSPPVGLVSDGMVLAQYAQLTLFIVRYGVTRKEHLKHIRELHEKGQLTHTAIVFNAVNMKRVNQGYGAGYGYGYGYGAEYGKYFEGDEDSQKGVTGWLKRMRGNA